MHGSLKYAVTSSRSEFAGLAACCSKRLIGLEGLRFHFADLCRFTAGSAGGIKGGAGSEVVVVVDGSGVKLSSGLGCDNELPEIFSR